MTKMAVLILGAPRSGTSYISSLIEGMGFYFGEKEDFVDPSLHIHNPEFYELERLNQINEDLYNAIYSTKKEWINFFNFKSCDFNLKIYNNHKDEMSYVIVNLLKNNNAIALKDPRFCFTLSYWNKLLQDLGYRIFHILATRSLNAIALSNCKIANSPIGHGYRIATWSYFNAMKVLSNTSYKIINYDALMNGELESLKEVAHLLEKDMDVEFLYKQKTDKTLRHQINSDYPNKTLDVLNTKLTKGVLTSEDYNLFVEQMNAYGIDELINRLEANKNFTQLFLDLGNGFNEENSIKLPVAQNTENQEFTFDLTDKQNIKTLRLDPLNECCVIELESLHVKKENEIIDLVPYIQTNAEINHCKAYFFITDDSQMYLSGFDESTFENAQSLVVVLRYVHIAKDALHVSVKQKNQELSIKEQNINALNQELSIKEQNINALNQELSIKEQNIQRLSSELVGMYQSNSWKMTKPLRSLMRSIKKWVR